MEVNVLGSLRHDFEDVEELLLFELQQLSQLFGSHLLLVCGQVVHAFSRDKHSLFGKSLEILWRLLILSLHLVGVLGHHLDWRHEGVI